MFAPAILKLLADGARGLRKQAFCLQLRHRLGRGRLAIDACCGACVAGNTRAGWGRCDRRAIVRGQIGRARACIGWSGIGWAIVYGAAASAAIGCARHAGVISSFLGSIHILGLDGRLSVFD